MRRWHQIGLGVGLTLIGMFDADYLQWVPGANLDSALILMGGWFLGRTSVAALRSPV